MHPGWYADPFAPQGLRWWDGTQWTHWTAPGNPAVSAFHDPLRDLAAEESIGRWARMGLVAAAVINGGVYLTTAVVWHRLLRDIVHQFRVAADNPGTTPRLHLRIADVLFLDGLGLIQFGLQILLIVWLYRAATFGRRAGVPARHDPNWAWAGFFVPIVNFWFPYQVAADTTPPGNPARAFALRWWWSWIGQALVSTAVFVVSYFSVAAALIVACAGVVLAALTARYGRAMISAVLASHREIASGVAVP